MGLVTTFAHSGRPRTSIVSIEPLVEPKGEPMHAGYPLGDAIGGVFGELSVRENIIIALQSKRGWLRRLSRDEQERLAQEMIKTLGIATPDADKPVEQLSGGNQQKVVLARWLALRPKVLIVDEPTRGIDVGAKVEVHNLLFEMANAGIAVIAISSELPELLGMSDRILVMREGRQMAIFSREEVTQEKIMTAAMGQALVHEGVPA